MTATPQKAHEMAEALGIVVRPPDGHELVGYTWEHSDGSFLPRRRP